MISEEHWVKPFLAWPVPQPPGTHFLYNSGATFMLSAIVQKLTGQRVLDYLTPRLFEPLGIREATWETTPDGINTGGWGLSVHTEDIAKLGQFCLQKGAWNGRRLLRGVDRRSDRLSHPAAAEGRIPRARRSRTTGSRATATNSGAARTAPTAAMAPSGSSWSCCPRRMRSS